MKHGQTKKTNIIIAGGGFAGLDAAKYLDKRLARRRDVEVTAHAAATNSVARRAMMFQT
jgi:NADH dehydrogenase FAD-containing subunit